MNEEMNNQVVNEVEEQVVEAAKKSKNPVVKIVLGIVGAGAIVGGVYLVRKHIKKKAAVGNVVQLVEPTEEESEENESAEE